MSVGMMAGEFGGQSEIGRGGWSCAQVSASDPPYDWELVEGEVVVRGRIGYRHRLIRDALVRALGSARRAPYAIRADQRIVLGEFSALRPDVVVVDESAVEMYAAEGIPAAAAVLVVEIVSDDSRGDDWYRTPRLYAAAGIANFWRVERGLDDRPIVYQYWLDDESREYVPAPTPIHSGTLSTAVPFPVRVDLSAIYTPRPDGRASRRSDGRGLSPRPGAGCGGGSRRPIESVATGW
ncbi:Uma2 family endonuclease [Nocardia miyunensis]|uniref:Uma2 family endonuclease n=1 Tax=Nocardia miyunensis TaxID=282684 RepID=UPI000AEF3247|nr:Uma2 family endonuclease [Nocardia miyunensis]